MSDLAAIDLDELIDGQQIGLSTIIFLIVASLVLVSDGFDLSVIGYVGPELVKQWHIAPRQLVPVFSAGILGLACGGPILSFVGDRFGRKTAIIIGLTIFGALSLMTMAASTLPQLSALRFVTGIGLGGVIPNVLAMVAEVAPRRLRGRFVVLVSFGVPAGISLPGLAAAALVPRFGWPVLFCIGGILPLATSVLAIFMLPESLKFLAQRNAQAIKVRQAARVLRPDLSIGIATRIVVSRRITERARGSVRGLFSPGLAIVTPMLWIALAANQMANFFSLTWLPTLLQSTGSTTAQAGISASLFSIGGIAGGICLTFIIDRFGVIPLAVLFIIGTPLVSAMAVSGLSSVEHQMIIAGAGFCVSGINFGINAAMGAIYPTEIRSTGIGWAQGIGRIGALAAPIAGGALLAWRIPLEKLPLAPAFMLGVGAFVCMVLAAFCYRRFADFQLHEFH